MAKQRITRKQLLKEPDEFLTFSAKALQWATTYQRQLIYGVIGVAVLFLAVSLFRYMDQREEQRAFGVFQEGYGLYVSGRTEGSTAMDGAAKEKFAELVEKYGSTSAARLALPLYADVSFREGDFDKAIDLYEKTLKAFDQDRAFQAMAWNGLAYAYEGKKDFQSAARWFEKLTQSGTDLMKGDAYYNLGRMYEALADKEKAAAAYQKVADEYSESVHARLAKEKAGRLQG